MPPVLGPASQVASQIERLALSCPNPRGRPWHAISTSYGEKGFLVRAWDSTRRNDHECWVSFDVLNANSVESIINVSLCNTAHHSARVRDYVLRSLQSQYGRPQDLPS
jgi:hypothetical protein